MKTTQIWEIEFNCRDKKYVNATGLDDALQRARDWTQEEMDRCKKKGKDFDENEFAESFDVVAIRIYVETDI